MSSDREVIHPMKSWQEMQYLSVANKNVARWDCKQIETWVERKRGEYLESDTGGAGAS